MNSVIGFPFEFGSNIEEDLVILEQDVNNELRLNGIFDTIQNKEFPIDAMIRISKKRFGITINDWKIVCEIENKGSKLNVFSVGLNKRQVNTIDYNLFSSNNTKSRNLDFYNVPSIYENYRCFKNETFYTFSLAYDCVRSSNWKRLKIIK